MNLYGPQLPQCGQLVAVRIIRRGQIIRHVELVEYGQRIHNLTPDSYSRFRAILPQRGVVYVGRIEPSSEITILDGPEASRYLADRYLPAVHIFAMVTAAASRENLDADLIYRQYVWPLYERNATVKLADVCAVLPANLATHIATLR